MQPYLLQFLLMALAGWVNRKQQDAIEYLKEENRVLREHLGGRRIRFSNEQRRRLARKAKALGREGLREISGLVTPDTLLRWYRKLIAGKYDGNHPVATADDSAKAVPDTRHLAVAFPETNPRISHTPLRCAGQPQ